MNSIMKLIPLLILTFFVGLTSAFATAQLPDKIIYKGKKYNLHSNPLENYFQLHPNKRPNSKIIVTSMRRGYVATFKIKNGQLFLKDIKVQVSMRRKKSVLKDLFPNQKNIKVDWFTGLLVIPVGEMVNPVFVGYGSTFEKYTLLEIDSGDFKKEKQFKLPQYEQFKEEQFQAFKKTPKYEELKSDLKKNDIPDELIDTFMKSAIIEYTSKILVE